MLAAARHSWSISCVDQSYLFGFSYPRLLLLASIRQVLSGNSPSPLFVVGDYKFAQHVARQGMPLHIQHCQP